MVPTRHLVFGLLLLACSSGEELGQTVTLANQAYDAAPLRPRLLRDVAMVDDQRQHTHPYVPGHRTTMDGRVALRVQGGTRDIERLSTHLTFYLFSPERLAEPILPGPPGAHLLADPAGFDVVFPPALDPAVFRLGHHAVCDPSSPFPQPGERPNPYPCGPDGQHDCYDLTVISSTSPGLGAQLWGTPAYVEVEHPKTDRAQIVSVELGEPVKGTFLPLSTEWTEPAVTADGRLLTGRLGRVPRPWTNPETGETLIRPYDLAYSVLPDGAPPCDVTGWTQFHPLSHAPYDPMMIGRYGLADYPLRDTEGELIPDGEDMGGTYPWVDREGANLFMTGVHGRLVEQSPTQYPRRCVHDGCEAYEESVDFDRGFMIAGRWTHGKLVHLDGLINNIDWAVGVHPDTHWWVDLYRDERGQPVPVRFGSGRFIEVFRDSGDYPPGYTHNANILDSLQNLLNAHPAAQPVTPRDVVWVMSSGVATAEVAFDDLLDPDAILVSNMQPSITQVYKDGASTSVPHQHNGQVRELIGQPPLAAYVLQPDAEAPIHLQNGATSLRWQVPPYGWVQAGTGRTEPVALGGVEGRGFWLSGDNAIRYTLADQPALDEVDAYLGIAVDPRTSGEEIRELLRFGDGTAIALAGAERVLYLRGDTLAHEVALPPTEGWLHLGFRLQAAHRSVTLVHNGFALDQFETPLPLFQLGGGELVVGRERASWSGFRGWIDDLIVLAHDVDPEVACNHARGTLIGGDLSGEWDDRAGAYPDWAHREVAAAAGVPGERFACYQDLRADLAAHLANLPAGSERLRERILFPEGPLQAGAPRPDSSQNAFCLTCHHPEGTGGLDLDALAARPGLPAESDPRRQPHQPPRRVFGNIPAGWIPPGPGPGSPAESLTAPPEGLLIDPWILPSGPR